MDSSSSASSQNSWLAFSLSNHPHLHLSLFEAFSSPNHPASVVDSTATTTVTTTTEGQDHAPAGATDLAMFTGGGPKLEDFLGGGGGGVSAAPQSLGQFSTETTPMPMSSSNINNSSMINSGTAENMMYDSELKTIAASFLRGYNSSAAAQIEPQNHLQTAPTAAAAPPPAAAIVPADTVAKKAVDTFGQRTSIYRGVTRHRWTGRYEAHLWDNSCRREGQSRKGRQVYLGGYDKEDKAARAYDLAALKYWGPTTTTNFPVCNYEKELEEMKNMTRQEFVASLRRKSSGFSRGASIYRGVTRHHQHGRWQARIGRVAGNKDLYLGTFSTQEEAAEAYDIAAIKFRGLNAVTNFDMSRYDVKSIASSNLPIGGMSNTKSTKLISSPDGHSLSADTKSATADDRDGSGALSSAASSASTLSFAFPIKQDPSPDYWSNIFGFQNPNNIPLNAITVAKNPSTTSNPPSSVPFNMDFSSTTSTTGSTISSHDHHQITNNVGGFFTYTNHQQQSGGSTSTSCTGTVQFAMPNFGTTNSNNSNNNINSYETSSSGYNVNGIGWNNIGPTLHTFHPHHHHQHHHQTHAKPSTLFQTPIFGME